MRKWIFFSFLSLFSYIYLEAQSTKPKSDAEVAIAQKYEPGGLYKMEVVEMDKKGYALQVASFSSYPNVVRYVTGLQARWFRNILMKMDETGANEVQYKVLLGPFPDKNAAVSYQQFAKKQNLTGFVVALDEKTPPTIDLKEEATEKLAAPASSESINRIYQTGEASYYHKRFHGNVTAYGEKYDKKALTAAHWELPYNTQVRVCRLDNNKCVEVRINDRGPNPAKAKARDGKPRIIDLSTKAAEKIDLIKAGVAQVSIEVLN